MKNDNTTDESLIDRIANGDEEAFTILAKRHMNLLYAVARRMNNNKEDAEEITQEALLRIWSKAATWKKESGAAVTTWLYRITYNLCIDEKRKMKNKSTVELFDDEPDRVSLSAEKKIQNKQTGEIVEQALTALPKRQRAALVFCHYQGLSNAEAATAMGATVKAVEGLLVRARKTLQAELQKYEGVL